MSVIKAINLGPERLYGSFKLPYGKHEVIIPSHVAKEFKENLMSDRDKGFIKISGIISLVDDTDTPENFFGIKDNDFRLYLKKIRMDNLRRINFKVVCDMVSKGYFDDLEILKEIYMYFNSKILRSEIKERVELLALEIENEKKIEGINSD